MGAIAGMARSYKKGALRRPDHQYSTFASLRR